MYRKVLSVIFIHFLFLIFEHGYYKFCIGESLTKSLYLSLNAHSNILCYSVRYLSIKISDVFRNFIVIMLSFIIEKIVKKCV